MPRQMSGVQTRFIVTHSTKNRYRTRSAVERSVFVCIYGFPVKVFYNLP